MRKTGPVTGNEIHLSSKDELVSATTSKGVITFCNDTFCKIAKFERDELLNQAHNIVRHPDMPPAAFQMLWEKAKAGHPWMGIVKNRCKDGNHYWVDAYVTPLLDNGQIVGYESVRVKASKAAIDRAETTYQRINNGQPAIPTALAQWQRWKNHLICTGVVFLLLLGFVTSFGKLDAAALVSSLAASILAAFALMALSRSSQNYSLAMARQIINDPLAAYIYTGRADAAGEIQLADIAQKARLRTALGRFSEAAKELCQKAERAQDQANASHAGMTAQQRETTQVANAMQQMSLAVQEVATGATQTSDATSAALSEVEQGNQVLAGANNAISDLSNTVGTLSQVMERLSEDSGKIASVVDVIRGIAEQTNLLALNAAIEAARAGEQGRGFAVVADEVRTLAQRTQESTQDIQEIIGNLSAATNDAASNMFECRELADRSVEEMTNVSTALSSISEAVSTIDTMSQRIAAAAEEQSASAVEIEQNTHAISTISNQTQLEASATADISQEMTQLAEQQFRLVERFH